MAQEKDKKKPKRAPRSKNAVAEEKPYVEQFSELLMVHKKNENSFLKFDKIRASSKTSSRISGASSRSRHTSAFCA